MRVFLWLCAVAMLCLGAGCDEPPTQTGDDTVVLTDTGEDVALSERSCGLLVCNVGEACCGYTCVDTGSSAEHCGACGVSCGASEVCVDGACSCGGRVCGSGDACCGDACVDLRADPEHCGACGVACSVDEVCLVGQCACQAQDGNLEVCGDGEACCPGLGCRNTERDPTSCGACGVRCGAGETCDAGLCTCGDARASAVGAAVCGDDTVCCGFPAQCQAEDDPQCECGTSRCGEGLACCPDGEGGQSCARLAVDDVNCGACGETCGFAARCRSGACVCQSGFEDCDGDASNGCESRLAVDPGNCGACGNTCASGEVCDGTGRCALTCQAGRTDCAGRCLNLSSDRLSCGACDAACPSGQVCNGVAACDTSCVVGFTQCGDLCQDLLRDGSACGACGNACGTGWVCDGTAVCALSCQPGLTDCDGSCANLQGYRLHCGACGNVCPTGEVCDGAGQCATTCQAGLTDCGGSCVDLNTEFAHCGACGNPCQSGERCEAGACVQSCPGSQKSCGGLCVDTESDAEHCGACGQACDPFEVCVEGACVGGCPGAQTWCDPGCYDLNTNPNHCGACDNACPSDEVCNVGVCGASTGCDPGQSECSGVCTDLQIDLFNCGACGTRCGDGQVCVSGQCACEPNVRADCDTNGTCETWLNLDPNHCGACGTVCDAGEVCDLGTCTCLGSRLDCVDPAERCETSYWMDEAHCGACNNACASDEVCISGACSRQVVQPRLAAIGDTTCYVRTDGAVVCWGNNINNVRGDTLEDDVWGPVTISGIDGVAASAVSVAIEETHGCAVLDGGGVRCWSNANSAGRLGCDGCTVTGPEPVDVVGISTAVAVSSAFNSSCALFANGGVQCWGGGGQGQLGNGVTGSSPVPVQVTGLDGSGAKVLQLSSGRAFYCALLDTGAVQCWGRNAEGQLGDGTTTESALPVAVLGLDGTDRVVWLDAYEASACVVLESGKAACWGRNTTSNVSFSKLGTGGGQSPPAFHMEPQPVLTLDGTRDDTTALAVTLGLDHTCFTIADGTTRCVGVLAGFCGTGYDLELGRPSIMPELQGVVEMGSGDEYSCARAPDGSGGEEVLCFGVNWTGQLGVPGDFGYPRGTRLPGLSDVAQVATGGYSGCAVRNDGTVTCWGRRFFDTTTRSGPEDRVGLSGVSAVSISYEHGCALLDTGAVQCWGQNDSGELGDGTQVPTATPVDVVGLDGVSASAVQVATGVANSPAAFSCALLSGGAVQCWGNNGEGQLGTGDTVDSLTPVTVTGLDGSSPVAEIALGSQSACARLQTGAVQCWGAFNGQLVPTEVVGLDGVSTKTMGLSLGSGHACVLLDTGAVWCWGSNSWGQLGDGTENPRTSPVPVQVIDGTTVTATQVSLGGVHSCALIDDGSVWCWGSDFANSRVIGTSTQGRVKTPTLTEASRALGQKMTQIQSGASTVCGVVEDGTVLCWGANKSGALGLPPVYTSCLVERARTSQ